MTENAKTVMSVMMMPEMITAGRNLGVIPESIEIRYKTNEIVLGNGKGVNAKERAGECTKSADCKKKFFRP